MPDIPLRYTDPKSRAAEKAARERSPLYWCHKTVTVWEYRHMNRAGQDQVNAECRAIEREKKNTKQ